MNYYFVNPSLLEIPLQPEGGSFCIAHLAEYIQMGGFPGIVGVRLEGGRLKAVRDSAIAVAGISISPSPIICALISSDSALDLSNLELDGTLKLIPGARLDEILANRSDLHLLYFDFLISEEKFTQILACYNRFCSKLFETSARRFDPYVRLNENQQAVILRANLPLSYDPPFTIIWVDFLQDLGVWVNKNTTIDGQRI